jgi:Kdo2-lipid IVA lauroyltransferase/acyltransferase
MDQHLIMYYLVYGFLYILSLLPLKVLYFFSDGVYVIIYHLFGYRKKVVRSNLNIAFPEKSEQEKKRIEKQFYKNFIDNFIETLKILSGGSRFASAHLSLDNTLLEEQFRKGKKLQFHLGHNFNWEIANAAASSYLNYPLLVVYLPVQSKIFDRLMFKLRSAGNNALLPSTDLKNAMLPYRNKRYLLILVADQVPGDVSKAYWMNFFGRPTPFIRGPERGAAAGDLTVMFGQLYKVKRGQYRLAYEMCTENASTLPKGELTRNYVRFLEKVIREHPEMWLWSHRRWKKEWKPEYAKLWIDTAPLPGNIEKSDIEK